MDKLGLAKKVAQWNATKPMLLKAIANNSVNFFKVKNFEAKAFIDTPVQKWAPRKKNVDSDRQLLVKTGRGRQSIHAKSIGGDKIVIVADAQYMKYHNEGTKKLPKRKFMGDSKVLDKENRAIVQKVIERIL